MKTFSFEVVRGFFLQTDDLADPAVIGANPPAFGLKQTSSPTYWSDFKSSIAKLQSEAPKGVRYGVCWFGRHGQGWHNVAESLYGTKAWDEHWSLLNGDGKIVWGPDPELTDLGREQARAAHKGWVDELAKDDPVPLPTRLFSSPLSRAASTCDITFRRVLYGIEGKSDIVKPLVLENLREDIGEHTCDKRATKTEIQKAFPDFAIEPGFTEQDELWSERRETHEQITTRLRSVLDRIFAELLPANETYFSITAHGGAIGAALGVLGHKPYALPTGGVIPVVIKATQN
ncbi:histidine phosphatase family containing protein [Ceratobasidium sp. AG-Ba]|nr:histidine phosphatase family containing protein [Ceratobasidium sp. AG-Ba]